MGGFRGFDERLTAQIMRLPAAIGPLMDGLSWIGEPLVVLAVGSAGFIAAAARGQTAAETAFILGAIAFSIGTLLKLMLKRRRPHGLIIRNFGINSYSFPSGHAFGTVIFYGLFAVLDAKNLPSPADIILVILITVLILLIGISRVYKGAHYPSDVLAGWLLGSVSLAAVNWLSF